MSGLHPLLSKANDMSQAVTATLKLHNKLAGCSLDFRPFYYIVYKKKKDREREI